MKTIRKQKSNRHASEITGIKQIKQNRDFQELEQKMHDIDVREKNTSKRNSREESNMDGEKRHRTINQ